MDRLPTYHIRRPRLTDRCSEESAVVIEAGAGYGKTVLAAEIVQMWRLVGIEVLLEDGEVSSRLLAGRLRTAVTAAGFSDAAGAMAAAGDDAVGAIDAMLTALSGEPCAIVIDDAHHATRDAAQLIVRVASRLTPPARLIVLTRQLPAGAERLRRAEALQLGAADLALRTEEMAALCRLGFGLAVSEDDLEVLQGATGGWTAAAVLAASRARRTAQPLRAIAGLEQTEGAQQNPVATMLEELLGALDQDARTLGQIAPLPLLDAQLLELITAEPGFFDKAVALGLPLTPATDGWWKLPGPVRDHLSTLGRPDTGTLMQAATYYERRGEIGTALQMLLGAGADESAARLLAVADPRALDRVDALELLAVLDRLGPSVLERYPWGPFQVAFACGVAAMIGQRARIMSQLSRTVTDQSDPRLRRAIDIELAVDMLNGPEPAEAAAVARRVLESAGGDEQLTRARAMSTLGHALCWRRDPDGTMSEATLREAARYLDEATELYLSLGFPEATSGIVTPRAVYTELGAGRPEAALRTLDLGLARAAGRPRRIGRQLFFRAQALNELGRHDEAEADLDEMERIGREYADDILLGYAPWERMVLASLRGDAAATVAHGRKVEVHRGDWWGVIGAHFLADAAESMARVGQTPLAWDYLARADEDPQSSERLIEMARCALLARFGDPDLAEEKLLEVKRHGIFPREFWRVTLLRAYAAWRRGDRSAAGLAARAFEEAARMGQPRLPLIRERELSESLVGLAAETGLPAAVALEATSLPLGVSVLGAFELTRGGRAVALSGQAAQLVKLVTVGGGRILSERVIEALWPEADPAAGRNRLRTVLGRVREAEQSVIIRDGELLALAPDVHADLLRFHEEARQALANHGSAVAIPLARAAMARYRGDLLADDPYEAWAEEPREAARQVMLDLLDLCSEDAIRRGDLDEARRLVERTVELAPYDDARYLRAASILREQGRPGAAISVLQRARGALSELGIAPPRQLVEFEETLAA